MPNLVAIVKNSFHFKTNSSCEVSPLSSTIVLGMTNDDTSDQNHLATTSIHEGEDEQSRNISRLLRYCKHRIVNPYFKLLAITGLKPHLFNGTTGIYEACGISRFMNVSYVFIISLILLLGHILQFVTCFRRDRGFTYRNDTERTLIHQLPGSVPLVSWTDRICHGSPIFIHLIPSGFHFGSFLYMIYLYRLKDDENLPKLIERVFIQASHCRTNFIAQKKAIRTMQFLAVLSITWIVLSCATQLIQVTTHPTDIRYNATLSDNVKHGLVVVMVISNLLQDVIQVTIIVSYSIHCYLLSSYLNLIYTRIQQNLITFPEVLKEIGEFIKLLKYLNNGLGPGLGLLLLLDTILAISGGVFLFNSGHPLSLGIHFWDYGSISLMSLLWFSLIVVPIYKIRNLTTSCRRIQEIGHIIRQRPFGFQDIPQVDLDSFLLFVTTLRLDVNILNIPISTPTISLIALLSVFAISAWGLINN